MQTKKLASALLAAVLALALILLTACGGKNNGDGDSPTSQGNKITQPIIPGGQESIKSGMDSMSAGVARATESIRSGSAEILGWPAASFPPGFPAYPDGSVVYADTFSDGDIMVFVTETGSASYNAYIDTLKGAGWTFTDPEDEYAFAYKGSWMLLLSYDDEYGAGIYVCDIGFDLEDLYTDAVWPSNLPVAVPVYPDGNVALVSEDEGMVSILIENTSKAAYDGYVRQLTGAGWKSAGDGNLSLETDEGVWYFSLQFDETDKSLFLGLYLIGKYDYDAQALEFTGWTQDEFTRQIPKPDFQMATASLSEFTFMAVFYNITVPMIKEYAQKVISAGFTVDGKVTVETATTYCYTASNSKGYHINLRLFDGETMYITVTKS